MTCPKCDTGEELKGVVEKYQIPFVCNVCGGIDIKYRAIKGVNFIWPKPVPLLQGTIFIPEKYRGHFKASIGVILSSGKGCIQKSTGKYIESWVKPGDIVLYDKTIPWQIKFEATDGKDYTVDMCNILDVLPIANVEK